MIANKLTGKKGVLFTAAYVTAFEEMQKALTVQPKNRIPEGVSLGGLARLLSITRRMMLDMGSSPAEIGAVARGAVRDLRHPPPRGPFQTDSRPAEPF